MLTLTISDVTFHVAKSEFIAFVGLGQDGWKTRWSIEFTCEPRSVNETEWTPSIAAHAFDPVLPSLEHFPGFQIDLPDDEDGEPQFLLCVFEHEAIAKGRLTFGEWSGTDIEVRLTGLATVGFDDQYGDNLPICIEGELPFQGVVVDERYFDPAEEKLRRFFDRAHFGAPERHSNGGVIFRPVQAASASAA